MFFFSLRNINQFQFQHIDINNEYWYMSNVLNDNVLETIVKKYIIGPSAEYSCDCITMSFFFVCSEIKMSQLVRTCVVNQPQVMDERLVVKHVCQLFIATTFSFLNHSVN